ncbi:hypothetical protein [Clostridium sp. YIM B02551]|uniref:hypothetical protein n=1 Tax=Clostridium sp. YIM B02551 TaxID=2910679 RepID=UPI001EEBA170|nr:hypothetical protein [Clostridium sp. YIM B02551]
MMYLTENSLLNITKKQYFFKLKTNIGLFFSLIVVHFFATLLTMNALRISSTSGSGVSVDFFYYSGNAIIIFTLIWSFVVSLTISNRKNKNMDFSFITNRLSSNISNIVFLITLAIYASITSTFSGNIIRAIFYFTSRNENIIREGFIIEPHVMLLNIISILFYIIFIASIGYFIGSVGSINQIFTIIFSTISILGLFLLLKLFGSLNNSSLYSLITKIIHFYFYENSLLLFVLKTLVTSIALFACSIFITNRLEVKK